MGKRISFIIIGLSLVFWLGPATTAEASDSEIIIFKSKAEARKSLENDARKLANLLSRISLEKNIEQDSLKNGVKAKNSIIIKSLLIDLSELTDQILKKQFRFYALHQKPTKEAKKENTALLVSLPLPIATGVLAVFAPEIAAGFGGMEGLLEVQLLPLQLGILSAFTIGGWVYLACSLKKPSGYYRTYQEELIYQLVTTYGFKDREISVCKEMLAYVVLP